MAPADGLFDTLRHRSDVFRERVEAARTKARQVAREVSRNLSQARQEAERTAQALGLPVDQGPVIDVGDKPTVLQRLGTAAAAFALALLIGGSLLSFSLFLFQFLLASLLASRILGLKLDLGAAAAR